CDVTDDIVFWTVVTLAYHVKDVSIWHAGCTDYINFGRDCSCGICGNTKSVDPELLVGHVVAEFANGENSSRFVTRCLNGSIHICVCMVVYSNMLSLMKKSKDIVLFYVFSPECVILNSYAPYSAHLRVLHLIGALLVMQVYLGMSLIGFMMWLSQKMNGERIKGWVKFFGLRGMPRRDVHSWAGRSFRFLLDNVSPMHSSTLCVCMVVYSNMLSLMKKSKGCCPHYAYRERILRYVLFYVFSPECVILNSYAPYSAHLRVLHLIGALLVMQVYLVINKGPSMSLEYGLLIRRGLGDNHRVYGTIWLMMLRLGNGVIAKVLNE
ncbi:Hypothetical predicted protein, partial [Mytilus galloprovincialis]